ncbi:MAG: hypothetical protein IT449_15665 [Phycisphaerales bacterium]|nr:hypothetical protein [Phycisphaerales bacterium]
MKGAEIAATLSRWLRHPRFPLYAAGLAIALTCVSLFTGLQVDDYIHRLLLMKQPPGSLLEPRAAWDVFGFFPAGTDRVRAAIRDGTLPWWAPDDLRLSFFRPLTSLTHWVDYRCFPQLPWLMHVQNLMWLGAMTWIGARLFRAICGATWEGGMAALLFAVDPAHGMPAGWVANRNALISGCFGTLAILLYVRGRQAMRGATWSAPATWLAPAALLTALASAELSLGVPAYLLAHALFLDEGHWARRLARLTPCAAVTLAWITLYKACGYGATASHMYLDPGAEPLRFLGAIVEHLPVLLLGQLFLPPADVYNLLLLSVRPFWTLLAAGVLITLLCVVFKRLRKDRVAGFWLTGMVLAALPCCGTAASNRLLIFVGIGGAGLIARFLAREGGERDDSSLQRAGTDSTEPRIELSDLPNHRLESRCPSDVLPNAAGPSGPDLSAAGRDIASPTPTSPGAARAPVPRLERWTRRTLVAVHLVLAPPAMVYAAYSVAGFEPVLRPLADSVPQDERVREQEVIILHAPTNFLIHYAVTMNLLEGRPTPRRTYVLGSTMSAMEVRRLDERTVVLRPAIGFLAPPGTPVGDGAGLPPLVDISYLLQMFDVLFRSGNLPFHVGDAFELGGTRGEVTELTPDGRPREVIFRFVGSLEDSRYRWVTWAAGRLLETKLPAVGESVTLPPARVGF